MSTQHLALVPRDGFFAKDGRGWSTSARTHVVDWPWPTTIRGALTTASGKLIEQQNDWEGWGKHHAKVRLGRLLALRRPVEAATWAPEHRMWPVPADALWVEDKTSVVRLKPKAPEIPTLGRKRPDGVPQIYSDAYEDAREALWVARNVDSKAKPLGPPRWWDDATLVDWLCGECVKADRDPQDQFPSPARRFQVHVGIRSDTLTGDDGILFAHDVIETLERRAVANGPPELAEWAIGAEVTWPTLPEPPKLARLGSDSRIAWVKAVQEKVFSMPPALERAFSSGSRGLRLMVVTPTLFARGWLPDGFEPEPVKAQDSSGKETWEFRGKLSRREKNSGGNPKLVAVLDCELILRAAFVPRPMHVSGWDMATGKGGQPRPTLRLVPPGAVYFFEPVDKNRQFAAADAKALWRVQIGGDTHAGFGWAIPGIWNPKDTE